MTWEGKQLVGHETVSYAGGPVSTVTYTYDEDGLRQTKTSTRGTTSSTTRYYYNGRATEGTRWNSATTVTGTRCR
ncbi:MAG: hypothetical protein ACLVML_05195 [Candidatus Gastranaerophilaceae bacterium]|nr:hypothetical protein [Christensenellales bacterium]